MIPWYLFQYYLFSRKRAVSTSRLQIPPGSEQSRAFTDYNGAQCFLWCIPRPQTANALTQLKGFDSSCYTSFSYLFFLSLFIPTKGIDAKTFIKVL